jgi:hypothetical protein
MADLLDELQSLSVSEYRKRWQDTEAGANVFADVTHGEVKIDEWASQLLNTRPCESNHWQWFSQSATAWHYNAWQKHSVLDYDIIHKLAGKHAAVTRCSLPAVSSRHGNSGTSPLTLLLPLPLLLLLHSPPDGRFKAAGLCQLDLPRCHTHSASALTGCCPLGS